MAIKKYGLDEDEIATLRKLGVSEDAIEEANLRRAKEQVNGDAPEEGTLGYAVLHPTEDGDEDAASDDELLASDTPTNPDLLAIWNEMKKAFSSLPKKNGDGKEWNAEVERIARPFLDRLENKAREIAKGGKDVGPMGTGIGYKILAEKASK